MSYNYERGGRRGRYNNYNKNRGARGGYGTRGYMPPGSKTRGYQQYMAPPMSMPTQMGVDQTQFLPPGIMEELKKKVQEKFPDADMSVIQDFFIQNLPINTGFQAMPFGLPNQHNQFDPYGGNQGNKNKKKQFQNKQEQPNPTPQPPPTAEIPLLFVPEEDNVISEVETEHYKEQAEFNAMSADDKKKYIAEKIKLKMSEATQKVKEQLSEIDPENDVKTIFSKMRESLKRLKVEMINNIQKRIEENIAAVRAELYHVRML